MHWLLSVGIGRSITMRESFYSEKLGKIVWLTTMKVREVLSEIRNKEVIARGSSVKIRKRLEKLYGRGNWRKMKGTAEVRLSDDSVTLAEIHWFEAHGIGKRNIRVKHYL